VELAVALPGSKAQQTDIRAAAGKTGTVYRMSLLAMNVNAAIPLASHKYNIKVWLRIRTIEYSSPKASNNPKNN